MTARLDRKTSNSRNTSTKKELIQDLALPDSCQRIKITKDHKFLVAAGLYPPRLRCFDTAQLSMKFERYLEADIVDFQILTDDYCKIVYLCRDRSIVFQDRSSNHFKIRTPRQGRDMAYLPHTADLLVVGSTADIYRINSETGCYLSPVRTQLGAVNSCGYSPHQGIVGCAGENGLFECFDMRSPHTLGCVDVASSAGEHSSHLTAMRFDDVGFQLSIGTSTGQVLLYDLRSSRPLLLKDHACGGHIVDLKFNNGHFGTVCRKMVVSTDHNHVRIWDAHNGKQYHTLQPEGKDGIINDVLIWPRSGLFLLAMDSPTILPYFIPSHGPIPAPFSL